MEVRNSNFAAFIDVFTSNTYVMVVTSDSTIREFHFFRLKSKLNFTFKLNTKICLASAATLMNMKNARKHFEKLEKLSENQPSSMGVRWFQIRTI